MTNKDCINRLKHPVSDPWGRIEHDPQAIDHAIAQLEMLDRLKEHIYDQIVAHQFLAVNSTFSQRALGRHEVRKMVYHYLETGEGLE
jgi:hypothetical protein